MHPALTTFSRRDFFGRTANGLMGAALAHLGAGDLLASAAASAPSLAPRPPHIPPRARAVIQLFMHGGPSQMDLFDPKPALKKYAGKPFPGDINVQQPEESGGILPSPFEFKRHGQCGAPLCELLPHLG